MHLQVPAAFIEPHPGGVPVFVRVPLKRGLLHDIHCSDYSPSLLSVCLSVLAYMYYHSLIPDRAAPSFPGSRSQREPRDRCDEAAEPGVCRQRSASSPVPSTSRRTRAPSSASLTTSSIIPTSSHPPPSSSRVPVFHRIYPASPPPAAYHHGIPRELVRVDGQRRRRSLPRRPQNRRGLVRRHLRGCVCVCYHIYQTQVLTGERTIGTNLLNSQTVAIKFVCRDCL
jgi:hypothetical protein